MNNTKKILLCCLCVVAIVTASVLGTLAYLTDTSTAVNTFTVGKVDITVDEEKVNPDGTPTEEEDERVQENKYHMIPGRTYVKDPTMTVKAGSEESYVRMLVTITCYDALQEIYDGGFLPQNFVEDWDNEIWISTKVVDESEDGTSATYEFRYHKTVTPGAEEDLVLEPLFKTFTVPNTFNATDLEAIQDLTITVVGHAIQTAGFADNAETGATAEDAAWAAFDAQMAAENG